MIILFFAAFNLVSFEGIDLYSLPSFVLLLFFNIAMNCPKVFPFY